MDAKQLEIFFKDQKATGVIVVKSKRTGKDYTFKLNKSKDSNLVASVETQYNHFEFLGYFDGTVLRRGSREMTSDSAKAIAWVLRQVVRSKFAELEQVEIMHTGRCLKCNRILTDAESIEIGLGPKCRS